MSHQSWVLDERLDTAQALSKSEDLDSAKETLSSVNVTLDVERDHCTGSTRLLLAQLILRVRFETGIDDSVNLGVLLEEISNLLSILHGTLNSNVKGLGATEGKIAIERRGTTAN